MVIGTSEKAIAKNTQLCHNERYHDRFPNNQRAARISCQMKMIAKISIGAGEKSRKTLPDSWAYGIGMKTNPQTE
jgi:hypothetical protein